jgi:hypothetical protein
MVVMVGVVYSCVHVSGDGGGWSGRVMGGGDGGVGMGVGVGGVGVGGWVGVWVCVCVCWGGGGGRICAEGNIRSEIIDHLCICVLGEPSIQSYIHTMK